MFYIYFLSTFNNKHIGLLVYLNFLILQTVIVVLQERFLKGRSPSLSLIQDIHVITCFLKDFLRCLREPLATYSQRPKFVEDVQNNDLEARRAALYQHFTELPQPNRDTLAYLILHFQR